MAENVTPYKNQQGTKKEQVADMFNNISKTYDFLNHFLSLGIDIIWRKKAIKELQQDKPETILDVATGTGDFAFEALEILRPKKIIGVDTPDHFIDQLVNTGMHMTHNMEPMEVKGAFLGMAVAGKEGVQVFLDGADGWAPSGNWMVLKNGVGEIRTGKLKNNQLFTTTIEPMHGNNLVVYTKPSFQPLANTDLQSVFRHLAFATRTPTKVKPPVCQSLTHFQPAYLDL